MQLNEFLQREFLTDCTLPIIQIKIPVFLQAEGPIQCPRKVIPLHPGIIIVIIKARALPLLQKILLIQELLHMKIWRKNQK
jgi:hypothetical protein